jgi:D-aminopeptidase
LARARLRDLGIALGHWPPGPLNALTDVPGVRVGHATVIQDAPRIARTGVTVIVPPGDAFAGFESFNGNGEMTGLLWVAESGILTTPVGITNTQDVGPCATPSRRTSTRPTPPPGSSCPSPPRPTTAG